MSRISVELVPREEDLLLQDFHTVRQVLPESELINIPDLMRMRLRSWDAAATLYKAGASHVIPHIRAIDVASGQELPCVNQPDVTEILVVEGDPPEDSGRVTYPNSSVDIIRRYQKEAPHLKVYAAFDPYRRAPYLELDALQLKREAGAVGFFTQPIFDLRMFDLCARWLENDQVFWGVSPVIGEKSRAYWQRVNHVVFPRDFSYTLEANIAFAQSVLDVVLRQGSNVYLMPLRVDIAKYLGGLEISGA